MTLPLALLSLALAALVYFVWNSGRRVAQPSSVASVLVALLLFIAATIAVGMLEAVTDGWLVPSIIIVAGWLGVLVALLARTQRRSQRTS